ncbi:DNAJ1, partial [Symbiodinium sp. CCMP2456]
MPGGCSPRACGWCPGTSVAWDLGGSCRSFGGRARGAARWSDWVRPARHRGGLHAYVPSLVAASGDMFAFASAESAKAAEPDDLSARLARLEKAVSNLVELKGQAEPPPAGKPKARAKAARSRPGGDVAAAPGLDASVLSAARAAGVSEEALAEMQALVGRTATGRLKPEPGPDPLEESEEEVDGPAGGPAGSGQVQGPGASLTEALDPQSQQAEIFASALVRAVETMQRGGSKASTLDRALDGAASGSGEASSLPTARRNSAARRALRDALVNSPSEISAVIEALMSEDLSSVSPGVAVPGQTSARAWAERRSKVTAYPSSVWAVWLMAGALDCLRTSCFLHRVLALEEQVRELQSALRALSLRVEGPETDFDLVSDPALTCPALGEMAEDEEATPLTAR